MMNDSEPGIASVAGTSSVGLTTTPYDEPYLSDTDVIVVIAMAVFGGVLIIVIVAVVVHSRFRHRASESVYINDSPSGFYRQHSIVDDYRSSTRSNRPLHDSGVTNSGFQRRLTTIAETSPTYQAGMDVCAVGGDSLMSSVFRYGLDDAAALSAVALSSICPPDRFKPDQTPSFSTLEICAQAPFSPYHLTWVTPTTRSQQPSTLADDDDDIRRSVEQVATVGGGSECASQKSHPKSPYHPNFNTPTDEANRAAFAVPENAIINSACSYACASGSRSGGYDVSVCSSLSEGDVPLALRSFQPCVTEPRRQCAAASPWRHYTANLSRSCPTVFGHWNYSDVYTRPATVSLHDPHRKIDAVLGGPLPGGRLPGEMASSNTSTFAMMGSSSSAWPYAPSGAGRAVWPVDTSTSGQRDSNETSNNTTAGGGAGSEDTTAGPGHSTSMSISQAAGQEELSLRGISAIAQLPHDESGIMSGASRDRLDRSHRPRHSSTEGLGSSPNTSTSLAKITPLALASLGDAFVPTTWQVYPFFGPPAAGATQSQLEYCQRWRYRQPVLSDVQYWV